MILADKITEERKKNGWSQEELANQLGVSRQAVSKWESAGAVPDLQRILQMSELFGVSTDYLLKDEMKAENITYHESTESYAEPLKKVTMENANEFLDMKRNGSKVVANATSMCISSPILLIVLVTMAEDGVFHVSESLATVFGCVFLLGMVAAAVFLFATLNRKQPDASAVDKAMEFLETANFFDRLTNKTMIDAAFRNSIVKSYSVMLDDLDEVRSHLSSVMAVSVDDWFGLPEVDKKLRELAEYKYNQSGCDKALEKIDDMDVADVKQYLKKLRIQRKMQNI